MPLRVKCRCGQEIVIRRGEWAIAWNALLLVGFVVNLVAVLLLASDVRRLEREARQLPAPALPADSGADAKVSARSENGTEAATAGESTLAARAERSAEPRAPEEPPPDELEATAAEEAPNAAPHLLGTSATDSATEPALLEAIRRQLEGRRRRSSPAVTQPVASATPAHETLLDASPLVRLLVLDEGAHDALVVAAFASDPDEEIARRAHELLRSLRPLVRGSSADVLARAAGARSEDDPPAAPGAEELERARERARERVQGIAASPTLAGLRRFLDAARTDGVDLLLAVDSTRSMEEGLASLRRAASWLLPALEWGAPGVRVGLLTYRDELDEVVDLSPEPGETVLARLSELRATGGGDVPEGVHVALRAALELGRFSWRPAARKEIVLLGDAPPPFEEVRGVEALARFAREEGGFRLHTIGAHPPEGRDEVPFFRRIGTAGGGRVATCPPSALAGELLRCLLGAMDEADADRLEATLRTLFLDEA